MADSNYTRGEMDIDGHEDTFGGFMSMSSYGGAMIIVTLLFPILVFGVNLAWPISLLLSLVMGVILGVIMKFKAQWYAGLIGVAIVLGIAIALISAIAGAIGG